MTATALDFSTLRTRLRGARARTLALIAPLSDADLRRQHNPLMSPIVWDLGHIAHFEEIWLLENVDGAGSGTEGLRGIYNAFRHPRSTRDGLRLPDRATCIGYLREVREAVLRRMEEIDPSADTPLLREGFVFNMVLQHEYQHNETILQTLQLKDAEPYEGLAADRPAAHGIGPKSEPVVARSEAEAGRPVMEGPGARGPATGQAGSATGQAGPATAPAAAISVAATGAARSRDMVRFPGGDVFVGTDDRSRAYDNERPRTRLCLDPFGIDRYPVDNAAYMDFISDGGYETDAHWSEAGLAWRKAEGAAGPLFWFEREGAWWTRTLGREAPVDPAEPVCHVSWYEADAFARWAGRRLPTEAEWEVAASWDPEAGRARLHPWGDEPATASFANLDAARIGPAPPGSYPANVSPLGCYGMIGDVWEWTASHFLPYPGFEAFPYPEYSEVFFGDDYRVLRGGSWATRPGAIRNTFRNWDYPQRRQIFSGFRCASDIRN